MPNVAGLDVEVARLADRLAVATPAWYAARPHGGPSRADLVRALIAALAVAGEQAGTGQPPAAAPPLLAVHALADQLRVVAAELLAAPRCADVELQAQAAVRAARGAL